MVLPQREMARFSDLTIPSSYFLLTLSHLVCRFIFYCILCVIPVSILALLFYINDGYCGLLFFLMLINMADRNSGGDIILEML